MLPSQEIEDAKDIKETKAITDFDPIKNRWIRDLIQVSVLTMNPFFFIFLLSPFIQIAALILLITLDVLVFSQGLLIALLANITFAFFIVMLAHAKYVAVPKLRETP